MYYMDALLYISSSTWYIDLPVEASRISPNTEKLAGTGASVTQIQNSTSHSLSVTVYAVFSNPTWTATGV